MMETIAVLFIFFILLVFGLLFYFKFQDLGFEQRQEEVLGARAMDSTLQVLFLPELQCSRGDAEAEDNCIDLAKLRALEEIVPTYLNDYYFNLFSFATVTVQETYPGDETWVIYDRPKVIDDGQGGEIANWQRKEPSYFVVALKDELAEEYGAIGKDKYSYGYLVVEVYS